MCANTLSAGLCAQLRSPASQNTMPRSRTESATDRSTLVSAPQALASTTPVSSRRDVPPSARQQIDRGHGAERSQYGR